MNTPELYALTSRQSPHQFTQNAPKYAFSKGKFLFFWVVGTDDWGGDILPHSPPVLSTPLCWTW